MPISNGCGGDYQVLSIWFALSTIHSIAPPFASTAWAMQNVNPLQNQPLPPLAMGSCMDIAATVSEAPVTSAHPEHDSNGGALY